MKKALKFILEPVLWVVYTLEIYVFNVTGKELPLLRKVWDHERLLMQRALNRVHNTKIAYRGRF